MLKTRSVMLIVRLSAGLLLGALLIVAYSPARLTIPVAAQQENVIRPDIAVIPPGSAYRQTNLMSDIPGLAQIQNPLLVNPWGISQTATSPFWIANNGTSTTQLLKGDVSGSPLVLNASPQTVTIPGGLPTGTVANATTDFVLPGACASAPCTSRFLFASITGNIAGWNPNAPAAGSTTAVIAASHPGHVYTGLAIGAATGGNRLYAADFANGAIDVYDPTFALTTVTGSFADPTIPTTPGNTYHAHNIQNIGGSIYITYAKVGAGGLPENAPGNGFIRRFNTNGIRDLTFGINGGLLDAPWGITIAPAPFGIFGGALLVGNFSDTGLINAYNPTTGAFLGTLKNEAGQNISIDELWALQFGNGGSGGDPNTLYFTAGTAEEEHGLFGSLRPTTASATSLLQFATDEFVIGEAGGHIDITVTRAGDASGTASVNVNTFDESQAGHASQKSDYEISAGKVTFNPGETSKTVRILIVDDKFNEGSEEIGLALSNVSGAGVGLGSPNLAHIKINENDTAPPATNPVDDASFFVRQHYLDFLNREPDAAGQAFWTSQITSCGADANCIAVNRINVSASFLLSNEFQRTGMIAYLANKAAFGATAPATVTNVPVLYGQFEKDTQALQKDLVFGQPNFDIQLEANKQAYFNDFVTRPEFVDKYGALTNAQYVDAVLTNAGLSPSDFQVNLTNSQEVPPTNPTTTTSTPRLNSFGTARFQINAADTAMTMTVTVSNLDFTGSQTADVNDNLLNAHIHAGATVAPGVNGPVVWGFFGSPFNDNNPNDQVVTPLLGGVGGTVTGKWDTPEGNGTTFTAQLANIRAGRAYINFHTTQFTGGEIRGNFPATSAFRDALLNGLNASTETRATVLRKVAESTDFSSFELNRLFVVMQYFGYLRRDPDQAGFNFWLTKLNNFGGNFVKAEMVKAFITSSEYRQRFGPS